MKRCPNCGRGTARTEDWACQWCGYPLLSSGYKKIAKTYRELQEERGLQRPLELEEPEPELSPMPGLAPEREQVPELEAEPAIEPEPTPEPAPALRAETVVGPERPQTKAVTEPEQELETEPAPLPKAAPRRRKKPKPRAKAEPSAPETEAVPEPEQVLEAESPPGPEPELEMVAEQEPEEVSESQREPRPAPRPAAEVDFTAEVVEVDIRDLNAVYHKDKAAAGAKLTDKIIKVTGTVDRAVVNPGLDIYYVLLTSNEPKSWNVRCTFEPEHGTDLRGLVRGHVVTVQGRYAGYERNILLRDCILIR